MACSFVHWVSVRFVAVIRPIALQQFLIPMITLALIPSGQAKQGLVLTCASHLVAALPSHHFQYAPIYMTDPPRIASVPTFRTPRTSAISPSSYSLATHRASVMPHGLCTPFVRHRKSIFPHNSSQLFSPRPSPISGSDDAVTCLQGPHARIKAASSDVPSDVRHHPWNSKQGRPLQPCSLSNKQEQAGLR
ncbi:hypothetical protein K474DRAFT_938610 [Panus rudis PR-1116 ss-1]|nr:hypothetical protein K474DRAFT_938610 [Panus rudis PR-1116 ss-1]